MTRLERLTVYPIKSLDPVTVSTATVVENGGLEWDRRYAILDESGAYVNGKNERRIHKLRTSYDLDYQTVMLGRHDSDDQLTFHLDVDRDALEGWLSDYFGYPVTVVRNDEGGYPDDTDASGPTLISTPTLEAVADWYDGIGVDEMRRRLRANLEVGGCDPFWEDRLYDRPGRVVRFDVGAVTLFGVNPCQRCIVPTRDPDTGEPTPHFRSTFLEHREKTLPPWAETAWFDHYFRLMVNTRIEASEWGSEFAVGDDLVIRGVTSDPHAETDESEPRRRA